MSILGTILWKSDSRAVWVLFPPDSEGGTLFDIENDEPFRRPVRQCYKGLAEGWKWPSYSEFLSKSHYRQQKDAS